MTHGSLEKIKNNNFMSPEPSKYLDSWLSQPVYQLSKKSEVKNNLFSPSSENYDINSERKEYK